ncbi:hypothetical protein [Chelatococcus asaccharovorans]|uniref:Uncharacterized protein n=1 Tax=Chelatococcus asaccharovorans TaxID=28210 RepID=A0A2V3UVR7_9HYPH|nr:hypothetical protein [Chelatococcus asaccharovorans]MBS7706535.1 hypothetical protein [Chelatococcus asaccharovorans]PXW64818.1 hypothetical protein C7450_101577 [Chelatococcus asaccharovorans]
MRQDQAGFGPPDDLGLIEQSKPLDSRQAVIPAAMVFPDPSVETTGIASGRSENYDAPSALKAGVPRSTSPNVRKRDEDEGG